MDDIAYRLGFGARRRAELAAYYRDQSERAWLRRPPPRPRARRRGRVYVRASLGCLGCSAPLMLLVVVAGRGMDGMIGR